MRNIIEYFLNKSRRIAILQGVYIFFELTSIILFTIILIFGLLEFIQCIQHFFFKTSGHVKYDFQDFIKGLLSSFEIFFLSPIPLLIIASFKRIIIKMYPIDVKVHPVITKDMISEIDAKKTFISSLIGVTATFILGQFIETTNIDSNQPVSKIVISNGFFLFLILTIVFLVILIFLYYILSKTHEEKKE